MRILAIGNSFSQDATAYLHQALEAAGTRNHVANLYIGGCALERHWRNIELDAADYELEENGVSTGRMVSVRQMLEEGPWDVIVTQQASHDSGWENTYEPFLGLMVAYLRERAPQARLCLQQTWAYELDSPHGNFMRYSRDQQQMYRRLTTCYRDAAQRHGLGIIPSGRVVQTLRAREGFRYERGEESLCRDGFHMHLIYGRYALACTWVRALTGAAAPALPWLEGDPALMAAVRSAVDETV